MEKANKKYDAYVQILKEELITAMGCTEPIAIAYCAAVAREVLGGLPEKVKVRDWESHLVLRLVGRIGCGGVGISFPSLLGR